MTVTCDCDFQACAEKEFGMAALVVWVLLLCCFSFLPTAEPSLGRPMARSRKGGGHTSIRVGRMQEIAAGRWRRSAASACERRSRRSGYPTFSLRARFGKDVYDLFGEAPEEDLEASGAALLEELQEEARGSEEKEVVCVLSRAEAQALLELKGNIEGVSHGDFYVDLGKTFIPFVEVTNDGVVVSPGGSSSGAEEEGEGGGVAGELDFLPPGTLSKSTFLRWSDLASMAKKGRHNAYQCFNNGKPEKISVFSETTNRPLTLMPSEDFNVNQEGLNLNAKTRKTLPKKGQAQRTPPNSRNRGIHHASNQERRSAGRHSEQDSLVSPGHAKGQRAGHLHRTRLHGHRAGEATQNGTSGHSRTRSVGLGSVWAQSMEPGAVFLSENHEKSRKCC